jgi:hypothetical protein
LRKIKLVILFIGLFFLPITVLAQNISDYLILQDINSYKFKTQSKNPITKKIKTISGYWIYKNSGALMGTGHFVLDHDDTAYETVYESDVDDIAPHIKVTQHTGGDSDRWLLHEVEDNYHNDEMETLGLLTDGAVMRKIDNKRVLWLGIGGGTFRWISNNVVINISYTDLQGTKPEPIEVVKAYLAKFPSTIALTDVDLKGNAHNVQWIKDEMDRRLWLCDKWNAQSQVGGVTQANLMVKLLENMDVFLKYRQKYFGISYEKEDRTLDIYQENNDLASINKKLTEYKNWWAKHKDKRISLP